MVERFSCPDKACKPTWAKVFASLPRLATSAVMLCLRASYRQLTTRRYAQTIPGWRTRHAILLRKTPGQPNRHRRQQASTVPGQACTALPHTHLTTAPTGLFWQGSPHRNG